MRSSLRVSRHDAGVREGRVGPARAAALPCPPMPRGAGIPYPGAPSSAFAFNILVDKIQDFFKHLLNQVSPHSGRKPTHSPWPLALETRRRCSNEASGLNRTEPETPALGGFGWWHHRHPLPACLLCWVFASTPLLGLRKQSRGG